MVRLYRTFSIYIVAGETRCAGCLCTCSGWFKHIEPPRTFSNHIITKIARCVEFCHMSSGWFDCTEPSLSTSLQGKQGMQGAYALVRGGYSTSNHIITEIAKCVEFCRMSSGWFHCTEPSLSTLLQGKQGMQGAYALVRGGSSTSNHIITEIAKCVEFCHMSSGCFDHTKPSLSGVQGAYALVRGGSSTSNLVEHSRTTSL